MGIFRKNTESSVLIPIKVTTSRELSDGELRALQNEINKTIRLYCKELFNDGVNEVKVNWEYYDLRRM